MKQLRMTLAAGVSFALFFAVTAMGQTLNGFDLSRTLIPVDEILPGGPPKDGIPAIDNPRFVAANEAEGLGDDEYVLGLFRKGAAKAYPLRILNWHEIVNDTISGMPIVVTYCPLCGSGVVFESRLAGRRLSFGVSGLLYNSDVLLYDRQTESLWSQLDARAISGDYRGTALQMLPVQHTTWKNWRSQYPQTRVLDFDTGYPRNYAQNPYAGYEQSGQLFFPVKFRSQGFHPKEPVLGLAINGEAKAWPLSELRKAGLPLKDAVGDVTVVVEYDAENHSGRILDQNGEMLPGVRLFWFAWFAFHPDTTIFRHDK